MCTDSTRTHEEREKERFGFLFDIIVGGGGASARVEKITFGRLLLPIVSAAFGCPFRFKLG